jgi:hypothetical protein
MNFENALQLQQDIQRKVFNYVEIPQTALAPHGLGPFLASRSSSEAASRGETIREPISDLALGIGVHSNGSANPRLNREFELIIYCQDRRLLGSDWIDQIMRVARHEARKVYVGRVRQLSGWHQNPHRPLRAGCSVSHRRTTAGTLGCFVTIDGQRAILSNNHVIANVNQAMPGDPILQPGRLDGGVDGKHRIATLHSFSPIALEAGSRNFVDAAVATLLPDVELDLDLCRDDGAVIGRLQRDASEPEPGGSVMKIGRTTGLTHGRIDAVNVVGLNVAMSSRGGDRIARFDGQIAIGGIDGGAFSKPGDSGSVVVGDERQPVGLCFAGSEAGAQNKRSISYANPMSAVLQSLDCEIFTGDSQA